MGTVFRARDRHTKRDVAVKLAAGGLDSKRFEREAHLLSRVGHPAVVRYLDHGQTAMGERFLVMDWVKGETLRDFLRRRTMSIEEALALGRRVASALSAVHKAGILHRDLKPHNIVLANGHTSDATVIDFGVALDEQTLSRLTAPGSVLGTWTYMSPEQATVGAPVDARSDLYALACVLFECLTGSTPAHGEQLVELLGSILWETPARLRSLRPDVPPALDELVARLLSKAPEQRPPTALAVLSALENLKTNAVDLSGPAPIELNRPLAELLGLSHEAAAADDATESEADTVPATQLQQREALRLTGEALRFGHFQAALHYTELALTATSDATQRSIAWASRAEALAWQARWYEAIEAAEQSTNNTRALATIALAALHVGEDARVLKICESIERDLFDSGIDELITLAELGEVLARTSTHQDHISFINRLATRSEASDPRVKASLNVIRSYHALARGDLPAAAKAQRSAIDHYCETDVDWRAATVLCEASETLALLGDDEGALAALARVKRAVQVTDADRIRLSHDLAASFVHLAAGRIDEATIAALRAVLMAEERQDRLSHLHGRFDLLLAEVERGNTDAAEAHLSKVQELTALVHSGSGAVKAARAHVHARAGKPVAAELSEAIRATRASRWANARRWTARIACIDAAIDSEQPRAAALLAVEGREELLSVFEQLTSEDSRVRARLMRYNARLCDQLDKIGITKIM